MRNQDLFEQITHGLGDPKKIAAWFQSWPTTSDATVKGFANAAPPTAWIGSFETMLKRAEQLRQMQLEAIHKAQERARHFAQSMANAKDPAASAKAMQTFAAENVQEAMQYWSAYSVIVQEADQQMAAAPSTTRSTSKAKAAAKGAAKTSAVAKHALPPPRHKQARSSHAKRAR